MSAVYVSVSIPLLCVSAWLAILWCVNPQCVCSLGHSTSARMLSIQLREGGVVVVGLNIFHVLLACLFPSNNSLGGGGKRGKNRKTQDSCICFFTFAVSPFEALFIFLIFFLPGSVFVLDEAFRLPSRIFRVKGSLCALLLDLRFWKKVHWRDGM